MMCPRFTIPFESGWVPRRRRQPALWLMMCPLLAGCSQNPFMTPSSAAALTQPVETAEAPASDSERRIRDLDANNRDLHSQLAQTRQQVDLLREQIGLLQKQLADSSERLQEMQVARQEAQQQLESLRASTARRGGAIITANSSFQQALRKIEIQGLEVRQDGDVLRVHLPADQLFPPGSAQIVGSAFPVLDQAAAEIARNYPRQRIVIEGHTDSTPLPSGVSPHQLAAAQAIAVFDQLTRRNRLPARQFSVTALGPNHPRESNATQAGQARNRRVELVIQPETYEN